MCLTIVLSVTARSGAGRLPGRLETGLPWAAGDDGMSGCGGGAGPGDVVGGELVEGGQCCGEFGGCVGPVGCHQRAQDVVVDLGLEVGEQEPVAGEGVAVAAGDTLDEAVSGQAG